MISNCTLLIIIILIILLLTNEPSIKTSVETFVDTKKCSPECCKFTQYSINTDNISIPDTYKESMFTCFGGCPCMTSKDIEIIRSRGGNSW
jgi:hypothetical protein